MITVKPYSMEVSKEIKKVFAGNIEYYIQRWSYEGEMTLNEFFQEFKDLSHSQELVGTHVQRVIYDKWGDNAESWTLYNLTQDRFYWDSEGHCLFDLFKFQYSIIMGTFKGYWHLCKEMIQEFKGLLEVDSFDRVTFYSTIWGGACPGTPEVQYSDYQEIIMNEIDFSKLSNAPIERFNNGWEDNRDLYRVASKWYIDWEDPDFEQEIGRGDLSVFQNHTKKTFTVFALRETEFMIDALDKRGL